MHVSLRAQGQKPIRHSKQGAFQVINVVEHFAPITKFTKVIEDWHKIPSLVREASRLALEQRPGPTHLELPEDIAAQEVDGEAFLLPRYRVRRPVPDEKAVRIAAEMVLASKSPLLLIGAGAQRTRTQTMLRKFVDELGMPFITTQMGKGVVSEAHKQSLGTAALSAGDAVHAALEASDCIIMVGHDKIEKPPLFMHGDDKRSVIHINHSDGQVDDIYAPHWAVVGDIANAIWQLGQQLQAAITAKGGRSGWDFRFFYRVRDALQAALAATAADEAFPMQVERVVADVRAALPGDGVVTLDNGLYKLAFARSYKTYEPNTLLLDNALATMGAGLPSGMAAGLVDPTRKVVAVCGDGGFMMGNNDFETAVRLRLNLVLVVLNDGAYGMIKWKQAGHGFADGGALDFGNPDFVKFAEAFGAKGHRIRSTGEFKGTLQAALDEGGVHLLDVPMNYNTFNHTLKEGMAELRRELDAALQEVQADDGPWTVAHASAPGTPASSQGGEAEAAPAPSASATPGAFTAPEASEERCPDAVRLGVPATYPMYVAGKAVQPNTDLAVSNKMTGKVVARVPLASADDIEAAIAAADSAKEAMAALPAFERKRILQSCVASFKEDAEALAVALALEAGKPIKDARGEVARLIDTFEVAAEEATRIYGEWMPLDISARAAGTQAITRKFPIGPVSMVSPFNFPLNLAAHKVAPAIAAGCPFVLKPASRTPLGALIIGKALVKAGLPEGAFSIVPCPREAADAFTTDERFKLLSFTGSPGVGWAMKARAGKKPVVLELGGNAAAIVDSAVDLPHVVKRLALGAFYQSGQSCIGVQRILIRSTVYEEVKAALVREVGSLKVGDPLEEDTFVGPLITAKDADRMEEWTEEALAAGAKVVVGHRKEGSFYWPTLLEGVPPHCKVYREEAFGPVAVLEPYQTFEQAVQRVNDSKFGLQAGVFTEDLRRAFYAYEHIDAGGVVVGDVPSFRVDSQPYGGVKDSGLGREGIRYAIEDMTETRIMTLRNVGALRGEAAAAQ